MNNITCGFIGLGLIGGSIARALKEKMSSVRIVAFDVNKDTLLLAQEEQIADVITDKIDESFKECEYIFLCAPVSYNSANLEAVKAVISPECILTDVGSVKKGIHIAISNAGLNAQFIGGHPMAGSERIGFANSKAVLLENAYYILTPTKEVSSVQIEKFHNLVSGLGAIPLVLPFEKHDYVTAAISHLPHLIASSLVNLVHDSDSSDGIMKMIAAGGFKDITRIASSSAVMWQQICLSNTENISALLGNYISSLEAIKKDLDSKNSEALYHFFDSARLYRDSFINASSGPIKSTFMLRLDIDDKTGALASVVATLASESINIKNIGITHNRESADGVVQIEFYDDESLEKARKIFDKNTPKQPPQESSATSKILP
ncbi:MAG: prephenate dehydrogenase [Acetatifactor sp.]|nr:prephenate dehydrogenase [Acetatifactor sp.]